MVSSIYMDITSLKKKYSVNKAKEEQHALEEKMANAHNTGENMSRISADLAYFTELANQISNIQKYISNYSDAQEILKSETDPELCEMAQLELEEKTQQIEDIDKEINKLLIDKQFSDEDDSKSAILEIRAGAGGDEAALFAADLFRMYKAYATDKGWNVQIVDSHISEGGGYKEVVAQINGNHVYKSLKYESGVHRVQRIPSTEASGRIHTSTASVAVLPEAKDIDIEIKPEDIRIDVMRASGAGGQCVNRTDSAVRITHFPSGIVVSCQETKHQAQNKEKAMALLRSRLYEKKKREEQEKRSDMRTSQIGSGMRAEKIRTYNYPQNRVTDHRIKRSWHNLESILYGSLDELIEDVREGIQLELLKNAE
jgi:peptide chain release factor 1